MNQFCFTAVDENGREYLFASARKDNIISLTLKKETIKDVKKLHVLPKLAKAKAGDNGFFITPRNLEMNGDLLVRFEDKADAHYEYGLPVMSCYGVKTPEVCALVRIERNYKYSIVLDIKDGCYSLETVFDFTKNDPVYDDIRIEILPLTADATLGDIAAAERQLRLDRGEIVPLSEKCKRDAVEYARKYPLIRIRMGWKQSPSPVLHQTLENEPEMHAVVTFARVRDIADALKAQGVAGAELQLVGWNVSGHDGRFPQLMPPEEKLGGLEELKKTIAYVKSLGYRISLHTNTIDAVEIADSFTWDDIVVTREGEYYQCGHYSGGYAYHVCPEMQLKNAMRDLPEVAELGLNGLHFTDVISIVVPDTCCSKAHSCYTAQGIALAQENIHYTRELFGAFSSEGCMDFALKELDYGLYVSFGDGFGKRMIPVTDTLVPFFELTYHGILLYNPTSPTVNYPIKTPADKLTFRMRGGRPSFYFHSKFRHGEPNWMGDIDLVASDNASMNFAAKVIADGLREYEAVRDLQLTYMANYEVLDGGIEVATYCDGTRIVGNFSDSEGSFEGHVIAPYGSLVLRGV